jgi:hypothetical protein
MACMGENGNTSMVFMGKPKNKKPLERHRSRWDDCNKMNLQEMIMRQAVGCCKRGDEHSGYLRCG